MSHKDDNYVGVLLEQIRDEVKAVHEVVGGMREDMTHLPKRGEFDEVKQDVKAIRAAVTDQGKQLSDHDQRITKLEQQAA